MKEEFKKSIDKLLYVNRQLNSLLKSDKISPDSSPEAFAEFEAEIKKLLKEKNSCIEKLKNLKITSEQTFSELKTTEFSSTWQNIQKLEQENLNLLKIGQGSVSKEMSGSVRQSKAVAGYKFNKEIKPRIFDDEF